LRFELDWTLSAQHRIFIRVKPSKRTKRRRQIKVPTSRGTKKVRGRHNKKKKERENGSKNKKRKEKYSKNKEQKVKRTKKFQGTNKKKKEKIKRFEEKERKRKKIQITRTRSGIVLHPDLRLI
jgi:hypothetical protein